PRRRRLLLPGGAAIHRRGRAADDPGVRGLDRRTAERTRGRRRSAGMKLLVLGGTKNLGRHVVEAALANGHEVTLFNRGQTNPGLFPSVRRIAGDRAAPDALASCEWDGVIDMSG